MSGGYEPVIGLEVHVQLCTRTKIFSACPQAWDSPPNTLTDPVVLGLPGALPVPNREAFRLGIMVGLALGGRIAARTRFDRKQYFYPDLPKGYQISQYEQPLITAGSLRIPSGRTIRVERAHLEEDAGKTLHGSDGHSLVDLNRCGVPLLEIVTAPDLRAPEEAVAWLAELKLLLRHLGASDCDMEKGSLRCDVNVSLRPVDSAPLGVRTEVKNLNSFKAVEQALRHEIRRQEAALETGTPLETDTRLWDSDRGVTRVMRTKEESADYRYFPDPDLPPCHVAPEWVARIKEQLPELPADRAVRYREELGLSPYDVGVLLEDVAVCHLLDETVARGIDPKEAVNWITGELFSLLNERGQSLEDAAFGAGDPAAVIAMVASGELNRSGGRRVLEELFDRGGDPREVVESLGLSQLSGRGELEGLVRAAMEANPRAVQDLHGGKHKAAGAIVGHVMRATGGRANPAVVHQILQELMAEGGSGPSPRSSGER